ncbi:SPT3 Dosage dependent suppressor of Ty-induced promoter mutations-like protein [Pleurotus ostreatus]|uniref:SPT3 Dosage dependent suppressor of Ty-induced promoter mutations-like protein n=1 Tax=Pleurotus ostreatus TaxID=5322 RepID=A0A8H7DQ92_PLEOS|nr:SPT3 Dosage dependent suppressor of Ty-induced promoter mutations-like protein [Pleurotus ostreatus]KAF7428296.1 SPT3 Dosage dependent suppressor of Ty-induced promoter mutations-like protein [Pleurotus ostreatus]
MASFSNAVPSSSRSPSPHTPEASDNVDPIVLQNDLDLASWFSNGKGISVGSEFDVNMNAINDTNTKHEDDAMLRLDDLLERHAFEEPTAVSVISAYHAATSPIASSAPPSNSLSPITTGNNRPTKPIPPPVTRLLHRDPFPSNQKVVHPPKESCFNLPIMIPSIPEGGTKSRVETQVRVSVELADTSSSADPRAYNRVGSWKWLQLPAGTATKKRTRKQGKIDPEQEDILYLSASVSCASPPHSKVLSCSSCQAREAKRVAKKLAARVRPRSDSDSPPSAAKHKHREDTTSIIQFNCAEVLDFSAGSVVLPLRITCYCRHHREKVGFLVHFTMVDHLGRIVGTGTTRPIMITDDHKTTAGSLNHGGKSGPDLVPTGYNTDYDWTQGNGVVGEVSPIESRAPSRRSKDPVVSGLAKRAKPYDSRGKRNKGLRGGSESSVPSPANSTSTLPLTRSPTPPSRDGQLASLQPPLDLPLLQHSSQESESSSDTMVTPEDRTMDLSLLTAVTQSFQQQMDTLPNSLAAPSQPHIAHPQSLSLLLFGSNQSISLPVPTIHRLIPNSGPTHGGIEVTVLGINFHPNMQLNCVFGDVVASSTQRWSDNTLVCILPPRATAGVVAVWFDGIPKSSDPTASPLSLFTYSDDSDRALMELALQVVGLKMTGKIEDAKNVAMRIVGNAGNDPSQQQHNMASNMMHIASLHHDLRPLLVARATEGENFEALIIDFLLILDTSLEEESAPDVLSTPSVISHRNSSGQGLLHLAAFLGFEHLVRFLIARGADLDSRDRNGCTPLHLATISSSEACARLLIESGADIEVVDASGKSPLETARPGFFDGILPPSPAVAQSSSDQEYYTDGDDDGESQWGDAEEDSEPDERAVVTRRSHHRRSRRKPRASGEKSAPEPPPDPPKVEEKLKTDVNVDEKQAASFISMIQRTLAQIPTAQGMIPNVPHLPGMPAVPWGALPQIPVVFPVFIPLAGWPSFLGGDNAATEVSEGEQKKKEAGAVGAAMELKATWEKLLSLASAQRPSQEELPPPQYTPRAESTAEDTPLTPSLDASEEAQSSATPHTSSSSDIRTSSRRVEYSQAPVLDEDIDAYAYRPSTKQTQKIQKKHDRMLFSFWLPVLLFGSLYLLYTILQFTFRFLKSTLPIRSGHLITS